MTATVKSITKPGGALYSEYGGFCSERFAFGSNTYITNQSMFNNTYFDITFAGVVGNGTYETYLVRTMGDHFYRLISTNSVQSSTLRIGPLKLANYIDWVDWLNYTFSPLSTHTGLFLNIVQYY
jgi:hypothetical protein